MSQFQVSFYKTLRSSCGTPFRCIQATIPVADAPTPGDAALTAQREFERVLRIPDWKLHGDFFEVQLGSRVLHPRTSMLLIRREPNPALGDEFERRTFECPACGTLVEVDSPVPAEIGKPPRCPEAV